MLDSIAKQSPTKPNKREEEQKDKKGIWNMDYTEENYQKIRQELN